MVVRVSSDVGLTPRAVARCGELSARREQLVARLPALEQQLWDDPQTRATVAEARRLLDDDIRFAADVDFAARQIEYLEALARRPEAPLQEPRTVSPGGWRLYTLLGLLVCAACAGALYVARRNPRPQYPEADARYREVMADLKVAFKGAGQKL
jgi:hypothetical protein